MKKKTLRSLFSLLMALVLGVSLLTGCSGKAAERAEMKEDAETIQVYLWTNSLYETYAPYVQAQLPDVNIEFIVATTIWTFTNSCRRTAACRTSSPAAASRCTMQLP